MEPVIAVGEFADRVQAQLTEVLADLGKTIAAQLPWVRWHVEFPRSRIYGFVGLLVFSSDRDPETELVVVTVELRESRGWTIDVTDRESLPLVEELVLRQHCDNIDAIDVAKAVEDIRVLLQPIAERIIRELLP